MIGRRVAWATALAAAFTMTVSYVDRSMIGALGPSVTADLGLTESEYGWIGAAFSIAYLFGTPLAGWWIDRFGARRGLVVSVILWSAVAALHATAAGFGSLFALRIALGVAESPGFPGAAQTVQRVLPPEDRSRGFGVIFTGSSIGFLVVPPVSSWLYGEVGWRYALLFTSAVAVAWLPLWIAIANRREVRARLDTAPPRSAARPGLAALAAQPVMIRALVAIFAAAPVTGFLYGWGAKFLAHRSTFALPQEDVGWYLWLPAVCFDAGAIGFGDLAVRWRRPRALFAFAMVLGTCFMLLPLATTPWSAVAIMGVAMAGGGGLYTLATADLLSRMPADIVAFAGGVIAGAQSLALIVMNPLVGRSIDARGDYVVATLGIGLWVVPGSLVWLAWRPRTCHGIRA